MKQLLFLFLLPCLAWAQYPSNGNQKITLGEQTTADGLIYRGVAATDTVRKPSIDTMAYMVLDTTTNIIWHYKKATSNAWLRVGGSITSGLTGVLPVANGGTGATTLSPNNYLIRTNSSGDFDTSAVYEIGGNIGIGTGTPTVKLQVSGGDGIINNAFIGEVPTYTSANAQFSHTSRKDAGEYSFLSANNGETYINSKTGTNINFRVNNNNKVIINSDGNVGIGTASPAVQFHTTGAVRFATFAGGGTTTLDVDNTGNLARTSSIELKKDVTPINYGLNQILQINPINFNWIDEDKYGNENENGFIAEDVMNVIPNVVGSDTHGLFMDYTKLIPILTKAIQEQNVLIKALEQRILILENK